MKRAKHAAPAQKMPAAQMGSIAGSAGAGILIDSDSDNGGPAQPAATARFGSRRLGSAGVPVFNTRCQQHEDFRALRDL